MLPHFDLELWLKRIDDSQYGSISWAHRTLKAAKPAGLRKTSMEENVMNWDRMEGNWKQFTGKVKEQWGKLTDDDLTRIGGNREQLEGKIQERYGWSKDQAKKEVDDWVNRQ